MQVRFCIRSKHVWIGEKQEFLEAAIFVNGEIIEDVLLVSSQADIISQLIQTNNLNVLNYEDSYIFPGLIDTNVSLHVGHDWQEIDQTTRLFSMGGVTTIACQPLLTNHKYLRDEYASIQYKTAEMEGKSAIDYCFFANIYEDNISEIPRLHSQPGVAGFKVYLNPPTELGAGWVESKKQMAMIATAIANLEPPLLEPFSSSSYRFKAPSAEVLLSFHAIKSGGKELTITSPLRQRQVEDRLGAQVKRTEGDSVLGETSKKPKRNAELQDESSDDNASEQITMCQISNCVNDNILDLNGEAEDLFDGEEMMDESTEKIEMQGIVEQIEFNHVGNGVQEKPPISTQNEQLQGSSPSVKQSLEQSNRKRFLKLYAKATIHSSDNLQQQLIARAEMKSYSKDCPNESESEDQQKSNSDNNQSSSSKSNTNSDSSNNSEGYSGCDDDDDDDDDNSSIDSTSKQFVLRQRIKSCSVSYIQQDKKYLIKQQTQHNLVFKESRSIELRSSLCSPASLYTGGSSPSQSDSNFSSKRIREQSTNDIEAETHANFGFIPFPSTNAANYSFDLNAEMSNLSSLEQSHTPINQKLGSKLIKIQKVVVDQEPEIQITQTSSILIHKSLLEEELLAGTGTGSLHQIDELLDSDPDEQLTQNVPLPSSNQMKSSLSMFENSHFSPKVGVKVGLKMSLSPIRPTQTTMVTEASVNPFDRMAINGQLVSHTEQIVPHNIQNSTKVSIPQPVVETLSTPTKSQNQQEQAKSPVLMQQERKISSYQMKRPMKIQPDLKRGSLEKAPTSSSPFNQYSPSKASMMKKVYDKKDSSELELTQESDSDKLTRSSVEDNVIALPNSIMDPPVILGPRVAFSEKRKSANLRISVDLTHKQRKESMPLSLKVEQQKQQDTNLFEAKSTPEIPEPQNAIPDSCSSSEQDQNAIANSSSCKVSIQSEASWPRKSSSESCTSLIGNIMRYSQPEPDEQKDVQSQAQQQSFNRDYLTFLAFRPHYWEYSGVKLIRESFVRPLLQSNLKLNKIKILVQNVGNSNSISRISALKEDLCKKRTDRIHMYAESTAAFLYFSSDNIRRGETKFKCEPPIGSKDNMEFLVNASKLNMIDVIGSFHFPVEQKYKEIQGGDFRKAFSGITTAGSTLLATWTALYSSYKKNTQIANTASLIQFQPKDPNNTPERKVQALLKFLVNMTSTKPARILNISHMKGSITKGKYADLVIWDPFVEEKRIKIPHNYKYQSVHIFHRKKFAGKVQATFLRGQQIYSAEDSIDVHKKSTPFKNIPLTGKLLTANGTKI